MLPVLSGFFGYLIHLLSSIYAIFSVVPFISFFGIWFISYAWSKDKKKSTKLAMDVTTALLIGSVSSMFYLIFDSAMGFYIIVFLFLLGYGIVGNAQFREENEIDHRKTIRIIWRLGFLMLSLIYIIFFFIGLVKNMMVI